MMNEKDYRQLAREVINKDKWWDMLSRFIDVLRINIFVIDQNGRVILPPEEGRYGGRLLTDPALKFNVNVGAMDVGKQFESNGQYLEAETLYGMSCFAIPIKVDEGQTIAYMIIGPAILNKRMTAAEYEEIAKDRGCDKAELLNELGSIRVVSNVMMNSILNLLSEIVKDNIDLSLKEKELSKLKATGEEGGVSDAFKESAQEIYSTVYLDGLLATLLDIALKMTKTECGSIMVRDKEGNDFTIKASRGLDPEAIKNIKIKLGEGVAGIAAKENASFLIRGKDGNNRIRPYLKRGDIKESLVMPLTNKDSVFGVLNLSTKKEGGQIMGNLDNLKYLSQLLSSAV